MKKLSLLVLMGILSTTGFAFAKTGISLTKNKILVGVLDATDSKALDSLWNRKATSSADGKFMVKESLSSDYKVRLTCLTEVKIVPTAPVCGFQMDLNHTDGQTTEFGFDKEESTLTGVFVGAEAHTLFNELNLAVVELDKLEDGSTFQGKMTVTESMDAALVCAYQADAKGVKMPNIDLCGIVVQIPAGLL